jgi:hypothetical protein
VLFASQFLSGGLKLVNLGDVPSWVEAIGTIGAFAVSLALIYEQGKDRRKDRLEQLTAQARLVSAWVEEPLIRTKTYPKLVVVVENGSSQVIHAVSISIELGVRGRFHRWLATMGPHEIREVHISIPGPPRSNILIPVVSFVDASGRRWLGSGANLREPTDKEMHEHWRQHPGAYMSEEKHPTLWTAKTSDNPMGFRRDRPSGEVESSKSYPSQSRSRRYTTSPPKIGRQVRRIRSPSRPHGRLN